MKVKFESRTSIEKRISELEALVMLKFHDSYIIINVSDTSENNFQTTSNSTLVFAVFVKCLDHCFPAEAEHSEVTDINSERILWLLK